MKGLIRATIFVLLASGGACRCKKKNTLPPIQFELPPDAQSLAEDSGVPAWPVPEVRTLDNGLLLHFLSEPASQRIHLRLIVPLRFEDESLDASKVAVLSHSLHADLTARARRISSYAQVELEQHGDRIEFSIHGALSDQTVLVQSLQKALTLSGRSRLNRIKKSKNAIEHSLSSLSSSAQAESRALATLSTHLYQTPLRSEWLDLATIQENSVSSYERKWTRLFDARRAALIVHSGASLESLEPALKELAGSWKSRLDFLKNHRNRLLARLHRELIPQPLLTADGLSNSSPNAKAKKGKRSTEPSASYLLPATSPNNPGSSDDRRVTILIGRSIPLPDAQSQAMARLAQRILQEQVDARLMIEGPFAFFLFRFSLREKNLISNLRSKLEEINDSIGEQLTQANLRQARSLWLGARIVELSSLDGSRSEDWTKLWSQSIDLSHQDEALHSALAQDATLMGQATPEALKQWMESWLTPTKSQSSWVWTSTPMQPQLQRKFIQSFALKTNSPT